MRAACADGGRALASGACARRRRAGAGFAPAPPCCANLAQRDAMSWRDHLKIHPAAELFPLMSEPELRELGEDIKAKGTIHHPIVLYQGKLLDGRNRLDAMEMVGFDFDLERGHARVFKKLFKASTFDREAKERINTAFDKTIQKLRSTQAALGLVPDSTGAGGRPR